MLRVTRLGPDAVHFVASPVQVGQEVRVEVDWERRFDHMQQHSGENPSRRRSGAVSWCVDKNTLPSPFRRSAFDHRCCGKPFRIQDHILVRHRRTVRFPL